MSQRLLLWFLLFSLVPLLASNTLGYVRSEEIIERLVESYLDAIGEVQARHVYDQVQRQVLGLEMITAGNEFLAAGALRLSGERAGVMGRIADRRSVETHLERKRRELRVFEALYLQALDGRLLAASGTLAGMVAAPPRPARLDRFGPVGSPPKYRIAVPVSSTSGAVVAYLGGWISERGLRQVLEIPEHIAGTLESVIVDGSGRPVFVSHPHGQVDYAKPLAMPILIPGRPPHAHYRDRDGVNVVGISVPVPGLGWRYVVEAPLADALGPLFRLRRVTAGLELALIVLLVVTAWFVAAGIVAPVRRLVEATRRVSRGDRGVRVEVRQGDELGELQHAFNDMTGELARASARVEELHRQQIGRAEQLATVGELASGVAHEIKNPVVGISNGLDLVRRRIGEDQQLTPIMEEMGRQLTRIESAVRDLLTFARPATPTLVPTDGNHVVVRAVRLVQPAAEKAGVSITTRLDRSLPELEVDDEMVRQAVVNLLLNAVQATQAGGHISVRTRVRDGAVELRVSDTGRGIPPAELEQIFKPFFTTRHSGTGLGLSITREIVERHGGVIEVESKVGRGSTFTIRLPAGAGAATEPKPEGEEVPA